MVEEDTNVLISGHHQHLTPEGETSDDDSNGSDDDSDGSDDNSDGSTALSSSSIDEDDEATSISKTSLGINIELDLDILHEDMLQDKKSTPLDD